MASLRFGVNSTAQFELNGGATLAEYGVPRDAALVEPVAAITAALNAPLEYPSLSLSTTPGDKVVLAIDPHTPQIAALVGVTVNVLIQAGVDPDGITVLRTPVHGEAAAHDPCRLVAAAVRHRITEVVHDPADRRQLAYLAASEAGTPILVNRALHDADLVIPIAGLLAKRTAGYFGIHGVLFPAFSDAKTQQRFRALGTLQADGNAKQSLCDEADHVAWLLGVTFTVQVVPAGGDQLLHVLAGECNAVRQRAGALYDAAWKTAAADRAAIVVAAIAGDAVQQTWENVGRAVAAAQNLVEEDGTIVVCCDLADRPGPALQRIACALSRDSALRHIGKDRAVDALAAAQLVHALDAHKVYLLSRLDPALVEDIDVTPIANVDELARLVQRYPSCILLSNAPQAAVSLAAPT